MNSVFISHSSKDIDFVGRLASRLEAHEIKIWLYERETVGGEPFMQVFADALKKDTRFFIIVLTQHSVNSAYVKLELSLAMSHKIKDGVPKVIPLLLEDCVPPNLIADLSYVDFTNQITFDHSFTSLLRALGVKTDRGVNRNHLLISAESVFTKKLRDLLLARGDDLDIGTDHYGERKQTFENYEHGLERFKSDTNAKWLFAVNPEDKLGKFTRKREDELLRELIDAEKHIIFFESGDGFVRRRHRGTAARPVVLIKTDYESAVRELIYVIADKYLQHAANIHIITVLGPRHSVADERRRWYNEFISRLACFHELFDHLYWGDDTDEKYWRGVFQHLRPKFLRSTALPMATWFRDEAEAIMAQVCGSLNLSDPSLLSCVLCGNDDIALGVRDAVIKNTNEGEKAIAEGRLFFVGFDGTDEMVNMLQTCDLHGMTMCADLDAMCGRAVQLVRNGDENESGVIRIPANRKGTERVLR